MSLFVRAGLPLIALIALIALARVIAQSSPDASTGKRASAPLLSVETQTLVAQPVTITIPSFGRVEARSRAQLYPLVSGQILEVSPHFKAGAFVRKGDWLLTLDDSDYVVALQQAQRNLAAAQLALAEEEARYAQAQRDWSTQRNAKEATDYALRKPQLRSAQVGLEAARVELEQAKLNLERTTVQSPFTGRLQNILVDLGAVVNPNVKLADGYVTDTAEVRLPISSRDLAFVDLPGLGNTPADAETLTQVILSNPLAPGGEQWPGKVVRTEAAIDERSQQLFVVARIEDPFSENPDNARQPLKIGQYIEAEIEGRQLEDALVVPNASVYQGSYVYVVKDDEQLENAESSSASSALLYRREVDILWRNSEISIVGEGLNAGDRLVLTLLGQVTSGTRVSENRLDSGPDTATRTQP